MTTRRTRLPIPPWLDWPWAVRTLAEEVRVPGELVDVATGQVTWVHTGGAGPIVISVDVEDGHVRVGTDGMLGEATEAVRARFHLDLPVEEVSEAIERGGVPGLEGAGTSWTRKPAASSGWAYSLTFLAGGDPDEPSIVEMFEGLGRRYRSSAGSLAPAPEDLLHAGSERLVEFGIKRSRAEHLMRLAQAFVDDPDRHDPARLRSLDPHDAVDRMAELPHIGERRARQLAAGPWGHDDICYEPARVRALEERLGARWPAIRAAISRARPFRSVACDTLSVLNDEAMERKE